MGSFLSSEPPHNSRNLHRPTEARHSPGPTNISRNMNREDLIRFINQYHDLSLGPSNRGQRSVDYDEARNDIINYLAHQARLQRQGNSIYFSYIRLADKECSICKKLIPYDDFDVHHVMCLTQIRVTYNEDTLQSDHKEECMICFDSMLKGQNIAILPCLCIFHKPCVDDWFTRKQQCPVHPAD